MIKKFIILVIQLGLILGCRPTVTDHSRIEEAWNFQNDPHLFSDFVTAPYDELPAESDLGDQKILWSGNYWPTYKGGTSYRWRSEQYGGGYEDFLYDTLDRQSVMEMTPEAIAKLSPTEKYDIYSGNFDFPLTTRTKERVIDYIVGEDVPSWYGICDGWAAASITVVEPGDKAEMTSEEGVKITFFASDIKALISESFARYWLSSRFLGSRCDDKEVERDDDGRIISSHCRDTNPGSFHLTLVSLIAEKRKSFIAEIAAGHEVWNQPIYGYKFSYDNVRELNRDDDRYNYRAVDTAYLVDVSLKLRYVTGSSPSEIKTGSRTSSRNFNYTLELDKDKKIIGGEWTSSGRPDFLWMPSRVPSGEFQHLDFEKIMNIHTKSLEIVEPIDPVEPPTEPEETGPAPLLTHPIKLASTTWPMTNTVGRQTSFSLKFVNTSDGVSTETEVRISVLPGYIDILSVVPLKLPPLQPGQSFTMSVPYTPGILNGGNIQFVVDIEIGGSSTYSAISETQLVNLQIKRNASLNLCSDSICNNLTPGRINVRAGSYLELKLLFDYHSTSNLPGPFNIKSLKTSSPRIRIANNTMTATNLGSWNTNYGESIINFNYEVSDQLEDHNHWIEVGLFEGEEEIHRLHVELNVL